MLLIVAFLVTGSSVTSGCGGDLILTASSPTAVFHTPNYPIFYKAKEYCSWKVSAPGNAAQLTVSCVIDIIESLNCSHASFSYFDYDDKIILCGRQHISRTLDGSTNYFTFKSSMCMAYAYRGASCAVSYIPDDIPTCTTPVDPSCTCGEKGLGLPRIVGGSETLPHEYPWQAMLMNRTSYLPFCGGSLIVKQWVLSAIHCVNNKNTSSILVALGEHDVGKLNPRLKILEVNEIIMHEDYGLNAENNNDIALLKLAKPVTFNRYISPICLPFSYKYYDFSDTLGITTGWGLTIPGVKNSNSKFLKDIYQRIIMPSKCTWFDGYGWYRDQITESMICGMASKEGPYKGDSGGPLVWQSDSSRLYFQLGVTSFWQKRSLHNEPCGYARVSQFVDWIVENTGAREDFCVKI